MKTTNTLIIILTIFSTTLIKVPGALAFDVSPIEELQDGDTSLVSYVRGEYASSQVVCTGFFADYSSEEKIKDVRFVMAKHCNYEFNESGKVPWEVYSNATVSSNGHKLDVPWLFNYSKYFQISAAQQATVAADIVTAKVDMSLIKGSQTLKVGTSLPRVGDSLTLTGYPWGIGA